MMSDDATGGACEQIGTWTPETSTCTLTGDVNGVVRFFGPGITLDGGGYSVISPGAPYEVPYGVQAYSKIGLTVQNISITGFFFGVWYDLVAQFRFDNVELSGNFRGGYLTRYSRGIINNCRIHNDQHGLVMGESSDVEISSTEFYGHESNGIRLGGAGAGPNSNIRIKGNIIADNLQEGIILLGGSNDLIEGNEISRSLTGINGWWVSDNLMIRSNHIEENGTGISFGGETRDNVVVDNLLRNDVNYVNNAPDGYGNLWNGEVVPEPNVVGGPYRGGNVWAAPDGSGFSDLCDDSNYDGICDAPFPINDLETDFYPLKTVYIYDTDGDGIPDEQDVCPQEDSTGFDADGNGCLDSIVGLSQIVSALPDDILSEETRRGLAVKVEAAQHSQENEVIVAAVNQLNAFIKEIEAHRGDRISEHGAEQLIGYAANVIAQFKG